MRGNTVMKALIHNGFVKFLLENSDTVEQNGVGIIIRTAIGQPDMAVNDISLDEVLVVESVSATSLPEFIGGKYKYENGTFRLVEAIP